MSPSRVRIGCGLVCALLALLAAPARAQWIADGRALCTATGDQSWPAMVADGAGGAIVTWQDDRGGGSDIYAQHVLASGAIDPAWPANGRALCAAPGDQSAPAIVQDRAGGAIVTWFDYRGGAGHSDIYAQHVLASGAIDPAWPANGRALCLAPEDQWMPAIVADGLGGAIVAWEDNRSGTLDLYAQHVLASGALDAQWTADGVAVCTAQGGQDGPRLAADGQGGALVTWYDYRPGDGSSDIYVQHLRSSGDVDPAWPAQGRVLCVALRSQWNPEIVEDGAGGAIVAWFDLRDRLNYDLYAQHVLATGEPDPSWPLDGAAVSTAPGDQVAHAMITDGLGGAILAWHDLRSGTSLDIYAQHLLSAGIVDPVWPANAFPVCTATGDQMYPALVSDGASGALVTWFDRRDGGFHIYAQRVLENGTRAGAWPVDGKGLCATGGRQIYPTIISDAGTGAIVSWFDERNGNNFDIYAQRISSFGGVGCLGSPTGNVAWWPMDESSGATAADVLGHAHGAYVGAPLHAPGEVAMGVRFASAAQYVRVLDSPELALGAGDFSIEAWMRTSDPATASRPLLDKRAGPSGANGYALDLRNGALGLVMADGTASRFESGPVPLANGAWHHVAATVRRGVANGGVLYVDGAPVLTFDPRARSKTLDTFAPLLIGQAFDFSAPAFDGDVDEVALFGRALSPAEVTAIYDAGGLGKCKPPVVGVAPAVQPVAGFLELRNNPRRQGPVEIRFGLEEAGLVEVRVFDVAGRTARIVTARPYPPGEHSVWWDGTADDGRALARGVYFASVTTPAGKRARRVVILE